MSKDAYGNPNTPTTTTPIDTDYGVAVVDRVVPVYPTTTARDAAITSPDEGQLAVVTADDETTMYDGSAWATIANYGIDPAADDYDNATNVMGGSTSWATLGSASWVFSTEVEVTVETGTKALVFIQAAMSNDTAGQRVYLTFAVSGATTLAASDYRRIGYESGSATDWIELGGQILLTALTPGSNTFTLYGRKTGGTATIERPKIVVLPL